MATSKKINYNDFIQLANAKFKNKYVYDESTYTNNYTKMKMICPEHGEFWQTVHNHLKGNGCPICAKENMIKKRMYNQDDIIKKFKNIHGDKYIYSKVEYKGMNAKVCIICPIHGEFWQTPSKHIERQQGCPKCGLIHRSETRTSTTGEFIEKAKMVHGNNFIYDKVSYEKADKKVCIICPIHGEFWMTPNKHLNGQGCPLCKGDKISKKLAKTRESFIEEVNKIHGNKYGYSKVEYINNHTKVCIICPEHGEFWQTPSNHLNGKGCSKCNLINRGMEMNLFEELKKTFSNNEIIYQYSNKDIFNQLSIDIFIPKYNIAIEYQGEQHFYPVNIFGGFQQFLKQTERDKRKYDLCKQNNITLLYANFKKATKIPQNYFDIVYRNLEDLIKKIKEIMGNK